MAFTSTLDQKLSVLEKTKKKLVSKRGPSLERRKRQGHPTDEINAGNFITFNANIAVLQ